MITGKRPKGDKDRQKKPTLQESCRVLVKIEVLLLSHFGMKAAKEISLVKAKKGDFLALKSGERPLVKTAYRSILSSVIARYKFASDFATGKNVLDIGCGTGIGLQFLAESAHMVVGVDYSEETIAYARKNNDKGNLSFKVMDCRNLKFDDGKFDLVTSFNLIEHIHGQEDFVQEVKRVLKPDGIFICSTPNTKVFNPGGQYYHFHVHEFTLSEIKLLIEKYFKKVRIFGQAYKSAEANILFHPLNKYLYRLKELSGPLKAVFPLIRIIVIYLIFGEKPSDVTEENCPITPDKPESAPTLVVVARNT